MNLTKIYLLDIKDPSNGDQLIAEFDKDRVLQFAQDWLKRRQRFADPANEANFNEDMDSLMEGKLVTYIGSSIQVRESKLDVSGLVDVMDDALHSLTKLHKLVQAHALIAPGVKERANSSYLTSNQAINLTLLKLKGQS